MFDSIYDAYRGVVSSVRVFNGVLRSGAHLRYVNAKQDHDAEEIGVRLPVLTPVATLGPGEVGYLIAGIKDVGEAKVGETVTDSARRAEALAGYREPKPMVFCGLYPVEGDEYADLREALERLRLNDSSFSYERRHPARSASASAADSSACCTWRSCANASNANTTCHSSPARRTSNTACCSPTNDRGRRQPFRDAFADRDRSHRGAVRPHDHPDADRVRRDAHGALPEPARRHGEDGLSLGGSRRARLRPPARGDRPRLLRPDEVATKGYASLDYEPVGYRRSNLAKVDVLLNSTRSMRSRRSCIATRRTSTGRR